MAATEDSFEAWYGRSRDGVRRSVSSAVGEALAAEAVDEAFARAFQHWDGVAAMTSRNGWVHRVAVNAAHRTMRRSALEGRVLASTARPEVVDGPGGEAWLLVADLPSRQREVIGLRHQEGLTEQQIATRLGVTRSTVSNTLAAGYRNLRAALTTESERTSLTMDLTLGLAVAGDADGCTVQPLDDASSLRASWGEQVRDRIRVRSGDLVAVDTAVTPPTVVYRWWHGPVVAATGTAITVERPATSGGTASIELDLPDGWASPVVGDTAYWGRDGDAHVLVSLAGRTTRSLRNEVERCYQPPS